MALNPENYLFEYKIIREVSDKESSGKEITSDDKLRYYFAKSSIYRQELLSTKDDSKKEERLFRKFRTAEEEWERLESLK